MPAIGVASTERAFYELAIRLDPDFALAHSGYADYFLALCSTTMIPAHEAMPRMRAAAQRALDLDPALPEAHAMLGAVACVYDYDWAEARRRVKLALAPERVSPLVRDWCSQFLCFQEGKSQEALELSDQALREDPLNPMFHCTRSVHLHAASRYEEAEAEIRRALELNPNLIFAYHCTLGRYLARGLEEEELASAERFHSLAPRNPIAAGYLAGMLTRMGNPARGREIFRQIASGQEFAQPLGLAVYHLLISDVETAADWMARAIEQRVTQAALLLIPIYAVLRSSPRWPALAKMMNLEEGRFPDGIIRAKHGLE